MTSIFTKQALLATGWANDVQLTINHGSIAHIAANATPANDSIIVDTLLPAPANLHSHSFQRVMAGMTEFKTAGKDNFWSWRDLMYKFAGRLTPDQIEVIAAFVFMEMQEAGYASVGEFHYVHHQQGGTPYRDLAELSGRVCSAAATTGIGLTHLPVFYRYGGAGKQELASGQLRFGNTVDQFMALVDAAQKHVDQLPVDCKMGIAPHSLRATSPDDLKTLLAAAISGPVHIHIAEQTKEVEDIQAWLGARPVEWLLTNVNVSSNWCLIHATHMTKNETLNAAKSGAVVGLCPITEANLGDGIFDGVHYLAANGAFGIGSDSNVNITLSGELCMLEYSQRLRDRARNVMSSGEGSTGHALYIGAAKGGAKALGRNAGEIGVGRLADLVAIDSGNPKFSALNQGQLLDGWVFAAKDEVITDVWSAGRHTVKDGRHVSRDKIIRDYDKAVAALLADV